jgi:predicted methyltransferase
MTVLEVWPGGGNWTGILGPYLRGSGHYYAAVPVKGESKEEDATTAKWRTQLQQQKYRYGTITFTGLGKGHGAPGSRTRGMRLHPNEDHWLPGIAKSPA